MEQLDAAFDSLDPILRMAITSSLRKGSFGNSTTTAINPSFNNPASIREMENKIAEQMEAERERCKADLEERYQRMIYAKPKTRGISVKKARPSGGGSMADFFRGIFSGCKDASTTASDIVVGEDEEDEEEEE